MHFDLRSPSCPSQEGLSALIHCAVLQYSPKDTDAEEVNVAATLKLRDFCRNHGIRFVFLSTMSAHHDAESVYGRHKFRLEKMLDGPNETVLKLGLVVGASGGLFQRISAAVAKLPVFPLIDGGHQPIQTVPVRDVCSVIHKVITQGKNGTFLVGSVESFSIRQLYTEIAAGQGRRLLFVPLPYWMFDLLLSVLSLLPLSLPVSKENLLGLKCLRSFDTAADLSRLGLMSRGLKESIATAVRP